MKVDQIYIINLNSRNEDIIERVNRLNFKYRVGYEVVVATNGWNIHEGIEKSPYQFKVADWWKIDSAFRFYNREITPGEIGCGLSHFKIIEQAYNDGHQNCLILEEDFKPIIDFPSIEYFDSIPNDWDLIYMGRNALNPELETKVNEKFTRVHYTYNNHAYVISRGGMRKILEAEYLNNLIPWDEFIPALNGTTNRDDAKGIFYKGNFVSYAVNKEHIGQSSITASTSLTEFSPQELKNKTIKDSKETGVDRYPAGTVGILDDSDWEGWCSRYINPLILNKEYDLAIDEPCTHVYTFPFFTETFCKELIELSEQFDWTTDRHEFYPTTDNLLKTLGLDKIYSRVINDFIRPLAINRFQLEGKSWKELKDESFIIKYPHNQQSHLSLHHDHSNLTTLVNLNPGEFEGGGTYFPKYKCNVNPTQPGVMTLHPGNITHKHGARPVTKGTRYVVVSFIKNKDHVSY